MNEKRYAIILAGGKGERFWPLSTSKHPKQFLSLVGEGTLLSQAVQRLDGVLPYENILVITNGDLVDVARKAAPQLPGENVIGEPVGRDTAAAIALGAAIIKSKDTEAVFAVFTADHIIGNLDVFRQAVADGMTFAAQADVLVTLGIKPNYAATGYGYIEAGDAVKGTDVPFVSEFYAARRFVEKPGCEKAKEYLEDGRYYWNSGMFIWSVRSIENAFDKYRPALSKMIGEIAAVYNTDAFEAEFKRIYEGLEKISIDYAVMEKADNVVMVKSAFKWDDVGSWPALENHFPKDDSGNTSLGNVVVQDAADNIVISKERLTALIGVKELIVVHADGATLVCAKDHAQDIKKLVQDLRNQDAYKDLV